MRAMPMSVLSAFAIAWGVACPAQSVAGTPSLEAPPQPIAAATAPNPTSTVRPAEAGANLQIKYVRDSAEYALLTAQIYRIAGSAVERARQALPKGAAWAVVLDIDETVLDNSAYELERAAYHQGFDPDSWGAWVDRAQAGVVPGVVDFVGAVRTAGGRVAFITNRGEAAREATLRNLAGIGAWRDGDLLCLKPAGAGPSKAGRRAELRDGRGACSWPGRPVTVLAYLGDQVGDFPGRGEERGVNWSEAFGVRYFLLPDPMYGDWTSQVTRPH